MKHHHQRKVHLRNVDNGTSFPSLVTSNLHVKRDPGAQWLYIRVERPKIKHWKIYH